jgi:hypothetical protein
MHKNMIVAISLLSLSLFSGCSNQLSTSKHEQDITYPTTNPTTDPNILSPQNEDITPSTENETKDINTLREEMIIGLTNMELLKIKSAFPEMIHILERMSTDKFPQILLDLENIINVVESKAFKDDLHTVQKLIQNYLDIGAGLSKQIAIEMSEDVSYLDIGANLSKRTAIEMLSDLSYYGVDYPYDNKSPLATQGWPLIYAEKTLFNVTNSLGGEYSLETQEILQNTNLSNITPTHNLESFCTNLEKIVAKEVSGIDTDKQKLLKEKTLKCSELLYEMRQFLVDKNYGKENLIDTISNNKETLIDLMNTCIELLPEGNLQEEYFKIVGYIEYASMLIQQEIFDYDVVLMCLEGSQQSLDDIAVTFLVKIEPLINKRYSGVLSLLEESPVLYDWINYERTGEYPDGGKKVMDSFNMPLYGK